MLKSIVLLSINSNLISALSKNLSYAITFIPIPSAIFAVSLPILPNPIIPIVLPLNSTPLANAFFNFLKFESPSSGIDLLDSCKNLTPP